MRFAAMFFCLLFMLWSMQGCSRWDNDQESMATVYTEILIAREQFPDTAQGNPAVLKVLQKYGFTEPVFRQKMLAYQSEPDKLRAIMDTVRDRLQRTAKDSVKP